MQLPCFKDLQSLQRTNSTSLSPSAPTNDDGGGHWRYETNVSVLVSHFSPRQLKLAIGLDASFTAADVRNAFETPIPGRRPFSQIADQRSAFLRWNRDDGVPPNTGGTPQVCVGSLSPQLLTALSHDRLTLHSGRWRQQHRPVSGGRSKSDSGSGSWGSQHGSQRPARPQAQGPTTDDRARELRGGGGGFGLRGTRWGGAQPGSR